MSVSLVRKALEISSADSGLTTITTKKNKLSKKEKLAEQKKKSTPDAIQKKNLKYLLGLDALKPKAKTTHAKVLPPIQPKKTKNKKTGEDDPTSFTDDDFARFEQEYFVS